VASTERKQLLSGAQAADNTGTTAQTLSPRSKNLIAEIVWSAKHANISAFDAKIQHSADGTTWHDLVAFTQITTTAGAELKYLSSPGQSFLEKVRAVTDQTGGNGTTETIVVAINVYVENIGS